MFTSISTILLLFAGTAYAAVPVLSDYSKLENMCISDTTPAPNQSCFGMLYGKDIYKIWHYNECLPLTYEGQTVYQGAVCRSATCQFYSSFDCSGDPFGDPVPLPVSYTTINAASTAELLYGNSAVCIPSLP